jgi:hypothetical protein
MPNYIHHLTLNTGHVAHQYRVMVSDEAVAAVSDVLDAALQGGRPGIPGCAGYHLRASHQGRNLVATVTAGDGPDAPAILITGVCLKSRDAPGMWSKVMQRAGQHPPVPFCVDLLPSAADHHLDAMAWTGDWSRCLAWAWLEYDR